MIPWMLIVHAADESPLEGEISVEPYKTPYARDQLLTTVKALHAWLLETTHSRRAWVEERKGQETSTQLGLRRVRAGAHRGFSGTSWSCSLRMRGFDLRIGFGVIDLDQFDAGVAQRVLRELVEVALVHHLLG